MDRVEMSVELDCFSRLSAGEPHGHGRRLRMPGDRTFDGEAVPRKDLAELVERATGRAGPTLHGHEIDDGLHEPVTIDQRFQSRDEFGC
jgi:hypothetical protein